MSEHVLSHASCATTAVTLKEQNVMQISIQKFILSLFAYPKMPRILARAAQQSRR